LRGKTGFRPVDGRLFRLAEMDALIFDNLVVVVDGIFVMGVVGSRVSAWLTYDAWHDFLGSACSDRRLPQGGGGTGRDERAIVTLDHASSSRVKARSGWQVCRLPLIRPGCKTCQRELAGGCGEFWIFVVKLLRAHGGCLGVRRR
jgi:hypothetical protein